ncbi:enoyl-ACP reductase [Sungkyunkwania multivorans]|uniref:Enoyl-ACP reductase n=1 Tax=Sungkyunkwania multivorans TaxID=1173618 RepID=A0ABW3CZ47_9FLAO
MKEFEEKYVVVLGGSSGLGMATAKKLAQHGMNIIIVHRTRRSDMPEVEKNFEEIEKAGVELHHFNVDATKPEKRDEVVLSLKKNLGKGKLHGLLHSIAKGNLKPMVSKDAQVLKHDDFMLTIDAMGASLFDWVKELHLAALFAADARVIAFTSEGSHRAIENYAAVSAAKATLEAITRSIALEYAPFGIKANCIQAGVTDTSSLRLIPGSELLIAQSLKRNPNKRLTMPEDVANAVYLLCKKEAAWINGTVIPVDGGEHIR